MQVNLKKLDESIQMLQEIRRIASNRELMGILSEFVATEDERTVSLPAAESAAASVSPSVDEIVNQVVNGTDASGSRLWSGKR
jgi:hypothetical protein